MKNEIVEKNEMTCFVLIPFDKKNITIYESVIKPTVEESGLKCIIASEIISNRQIMSDIWAEILRANVIIAELTVNNPNVFYELGMAHSLNKHVILLTRNIKKAPFDIRPYRHILYMDTGPHWKHKLKNKLKENLKIIIKEENFFIKPEWKKDNLDFVTRLNEIGIHWIYRDRGDFDKIRMKHFNSAQRLICMLAVVPDLQGEYNLEKEVLRKIKEGCKFKFLALNFDSPYFDLVEAPELYPGTVGWTFLKSKEYRIKKYQKYLDKIKRIMEKTKGTQAVEFRLYNSLPSWYIHIYDNKKIIAQPYLYKIHGHDTFMIEINWTSEKNSPYWHFNKHFDALFQNAKDFS